jgi:hypothetical protein
MSGCEGPDGAWPSLERAVGLVLSQPRGVPRRPIEYRVGRGPEDGEGFWSDSAFAAPDGREREDGRAGAAR